MTAPPPEDLVSTAAERPMLERFLDSYRDNVVESWPAHPRRRGVALLHG